MATTLAALKGKLGSTEYFVLSMKAKELVEKAIIPSEMDDWDNMTLEEREQRDINYARVKSQIVPYLLRDKDRFFGSIILAVRNLNSDNFEPLADVATKGMPKLYKTQSQLMGFLTFQGDEVLIPLDGQHRLKALKFAIEGKDEKGKDLDHADLSLASEDITVILVPYDTMKSRKIFTKVNRYAKPTTTGQNLVTDDDDIIAVLSRLVANELIGAHLVNYKTNTLSDSAKSAKYFTTLATIAECNLAILGAHFPEKIDRTAPIEDKNRESLYRGKVLETWKFLLENIELFHDVLQDKEGTGDGKRQEVRRDYLLGKPVPQLCLVEAFAYLTANNMGQKAVADRLNKIDWRKDAEIWDRLLMSGGRIQTKNKKLATRVIAYMAGKSLNEEAKDTLLQQYRELFPEDERKDKNLPAPV